MNARSQRFFRRVGARAAGRPFERACRGAGYFAVFLVAVTLLSNAAIGDESGATAGPTAPMAPIVAGPAAAPSAGPSAAPIRTRTEAIDAAEVRRKIAALAVADETAPYDEQPKNWLRARAARIVPQLIDGLNSADANIAKECLDILRNAPMSPALTEALLPKAGDAKSPLRYGALCLLEKAAADPLAAQLLERASAEGDELAGPVVRARWAWRAGRSDRAVEILKPLLADPPHDGSEPFEAIRLLGEIRSPAGVAPLEPLAKGDNWKMASEAYQALAQIDPQNHGLTADQVALLKGWQGFMESIDSQRQRMATLAKLNAKELRPLVMQMLRDTENSGQRPALMILAAWKDKEALPQIGEVLRGKRAYLIQDAAAAYLTIDESPAAERAVLDLLKKGPNANYDNESVLRGICQADIPAERMAALLRAAGSEMNMPQAVANVLRYAAQDDSKLRQVMLKLMNEEENLEALGAYCDSAARLNDDRFAAPIRRAVELLVQEPNVASGGERVAEGIASAGAAILSAAADYELKDRTAEVLELMESAKPSLRRSACAAGARKGVPGALEIVLAQLREDNPPLRSGAAATLLQVSFLDEDERAMCEAAALACLGQPCEDYAMCVLTVCGGAKSVAALEPILDDDDPRRAVYAAWVLTQLPDQTAAAKALRRLAIYELLRSHGLPQQMQRPGAVVAEFLPSHLGSYGMLSLTHRNAAARGAGPNPVRIPNEMLTHFDWDAAEQKFSVRCCRAFVNEENPIAFTRRFFDRSFFSATKKTDLTRSHLPLLREVAARDLHLDRVWIQGKATAHFTYRQVAARSIAAITGEKATYLGLAGEVLDSDAFPQPYANQDELLARYVVDRILAPATPYPYASPNESAEIDFYQRLVDCLREKFGPGVVDAIRREGTQRGVDVKRLLRRF